MLLPVRRCRYLGNHYAGFVTHVSPYDIDDPMWGL
jgi:hypothetical protein